MNLMTEMRQFLTAAGWTYARNGAKHGIWRCPCGGHQLSVSRPKTAGNSQAALHQTKKRVRQCAQSRATEEAR